MTSVLTGWPRTGYALPEPPPEPTPPDTDPAPPPAWVRHPAIHDGESVTGLLAVGDRLTVAYGILWTGGAHHIATVDLATSTPTIGPLAPTEGFRVVRLIEGTIYLPWADPTGSWYTPQGYSYSTDNGATWASRNVAPAYHWLDLQEHDGTLFICGSGPGNNGAQSAIVYRSDDNGTTWSESLRVYGGDRPRFYFLATVSGSLHVRTWGAGEPDTAYQLQPDGTWLDVPDEPRTIYGPSPRSWSDTAHTYVVSQTTGYIDRAPLATPEQWEPWLHMGDGMGGHIVTCATAHDGWVYVGGTQGRIWRFPAP